MSATDVQSNVSIRPGVGMLGLLASMSYKPWYALSEFVDNALASWLANEDALRAAGTEQLEVSIEFDSGLGEIVIRDNAAGIAGDDVDRAFKSAEPPPDVSGLSQFGIGMKAAACWYARRFTVTSSALGEPVSRRVAFDVPAIVEANREELPVEVEPAPVEQHGTTIVLSDLHRPIPQGQTLGKIRRYLASIYRGFLGRELLLVVKGDPVSFDEPAILERPRWDRPDGPPMRWRKDLEIRLSDGRIVSGWAALRERGSTKEAGLALLFRRKVVVGSGAGAGESEDLYRPIQIFGGGNSFVSQRLFGELDVSAFRVTYSKDAIIWDDHEEELLTELRRQLDAEPLPLLKMGTNYRVNEQGPRIRDQVAAAVSATAAAAAATEFPDFAPEDDDAPGLDSGPGGTDTEGAAPGVSASAIADVVEMPFRVRVGATDLKLWLSVSDAADAAWLRVTNADDAYRISITRDHPFMRSFAHLPNQEIEPVLRLAVALAVAEVAARLGGLRGAGQVRQQLNAALRGPLGSFTLAAMVDSPEEVP